MKKKKHDAEQITKDPVLVDDSGSLNMELAEVELKSEHFTTYIHGLYDPSDETSLLKQQYLTETLSTLEGLDKYHYTHNCGQKICAVEIENVEDADELIAKLSRAVDLGANLYHKHTDEYGVNSLRVIYNQDTSPTGKSVTFSMEQ